MSFNTSVITTFVPPHYGLHPSLRDSSGPTNPLSQLPRLVDTLKPVDLSYKLRCRPYHTNPLLLLRYDYLYRLLYPSDLRVRPPCTNNGPVTSAAKTTCYVNFLLWSFVYK